MKLIARTALWLVLAVSLLLPALARHFEALRFHPSFLAATDAELLVGLAKTAGLLLLAAVCLAPFARATFKKTAAPKWGDAILATSAFGALYLAFLYFIRPEVFLPASQGVLGIIGFFFAPLAAATFLCFTMGGGRIR